MILSIKLLYAGDAYNIQYTVEKIQYTMEKKSVSGNEEQSFSQEKSSKERERERERIIKTHVILKTL